MRPGSSLRFGAVLIIFPRLCKFASCLPNEFTYLFLLHNLNSDPSFWLPDRKHVCHQYILFPLNTGFTVAIIQGPNQLQRQQCVEVSIGKLQTFINMHINTIPVPPKEVLGLRQLLEQDCTYEQTNEVH